MWCQSSPCTAAATPKKACSVSGDGEGGGTKQIRRLGRGIISPYTSLNPLMTDGSFWTCASPLPGAHPRRRKVAVSLRKERIGSGVFYIHPSYHLLALSPIPTAYQLWWLLQIPPPYRLPSQPLQQWGGSIWCLHKAVSHNANSAAKMLLQRWGGKIGFDHAPYRLAKDVTSLTR